MSGAAGAAAGVGLGAREGRRGTRSGRASAFAFGARDAWLVLGTTAYAAALAGALALGSAAAPGRGQGEEAWIYRVGSIAVLATGLVWMSNTISHIHLHTPIFRAAFANRAFSIVLTVLLGIPQGRWKRRHLRHHGLGDGERRWRRAIDGVEIGLLVVVWGATARALPATFLGTLAPAWLLGLGLCALQGHYEHAGGRDEGIDHRGRLYNRLWFNDGYHVAHHRAPATHWTALPEVGAPSKDGHRPRLSPASRWPPLLRWLDRDRADPARRGGSWQAEQPPPASLASALIPGLLDRLERASLSSRLARALLLRTHRPALEALVREIGSPAPRRVCIVGGGLFPRTAILLSRILPRAELVIVDGDPANLVAARRILLREPDGLARVSFVAGICDGAVIPGETAGEAGRVDLLVVPLALRGARERFYYARPGCDVLVHDWMWRRRGDTGRLVSPLLLKRLNLVRDPQRTPRGARNLDTLSAVASVVEARCEPPCRTTALPTPTQPPPRGPASSTTGPSAASDEGIARRS